jgi:hypothetical protein
MLKYRGRPTDPTREQRTAYIEGEWCEWQAIAESLPTPAVEVRHFEAINENGNRAGTSSQFRAYSTRGYSTRVDGASDYIGSTADRATLAPLVAKQARL